MTEIDTRTRVYNFYLTHRDKPKSFTAAHFILEGVPKSTVYDIINRAEMRRESKVTDNEQERY